MVLGYFFTLLLLVLGNLLYLFSQHGMHDFWIRVAAAGGVALGLALIAHVTDKPHAVGTFPFKLAVYGMVASFFGVMWSVVF